jgi:hypothetical protein
MFLKEHCIKKIEKIVEQKFKHLEMEDGFLYLDKNVKSHNKFVIDRLTWLPYESGQYLPIRWSQLKGYALLEIYHLLKINKFYTFVEVNNIKYKVRLKVKNNENTSKC